ncbi:N-lysine methyltransferase KMT5A-A-like isoform X2 [Thalassophryne amazonica]|uniref:N-lysine methyltransferase KMT5A-A-like isoform X2 n=1 Tax=Thalassophryne amazonica TaxID=390379 RepID=UPI0014724E5D|nr:N-lysine methyltransferase KMT5A-A-like isoform X2 [Thalassophryne amazonica]
MLAGDEKNRFKTIKTECRGGEQTLKRMAEHHAIKGIDQTGMLDLKYINSTKDRMQRRRANPKRMAEHHAIKGIDQPGMLDIKYINSTKGRGVFAMAPFTKGEFVVEYRGQLIDFTESERRRRVYNPKCSVFMYDLMWHDKMWCIDAATEDGSFRRLVNDNHVDPNCKMKKIIVGEKPHLSFCGQRHIRNFLSYV